jgi:arylsulfatase A-like enzyme
MKPSRRALPILAILSLLSGCSGEAEGPLRPLLDGRHEPDVLTERRELAMPPSLAGSRFLSGWFPWRHEGTVVLAPRVEEKEGSRLELAVLEPGGRTLILDFLEAPAPGLSVRVAAGGREVGTFPLADPLEIPLPDSLSRGRIAVDLHFDEGSPGVVAGAVRPVRPAGKVRFQGKDLIQEGDSIVDFVRRVEKGETLEGTFVPPEAARAGQRFDLVVEGVDGNPVRRLTWTPTFWNRLRGERRFALELGRAEGLVRVRLHARGTGPAGRWKGLGLRARGGESAPRADPDTAAAARPEPPRLVVVYVMDALRSDTVGHLGGREGVSPVYDRLAREGVTFESHRSVAPNTLPSTKALFTGRPFVSRGGWKLSPEDGATLAERFRAAGWRTGLFSGNVYVSPAYGTDRGFEHVAEEVQIDVGAPPGGAGYNDNAERAHRAALAWLAALPPGERAFLYLHTIHPHNPYDPPEPFRSRYTEGARSSIDGSTETLLALKKGSLEAGPEDRERLRGLYDGSFAYNDRELGRFLEAALAGRAPGEALVALTSDHGEEHFEHGGVLHGYTLYEEMLRIPLVLWSPGRLVPAAVQRPTDTLDLHATLLDLAGLDRGEEPPGPSGRPLPRAALADDPGYVHLAAASSVQGGILSARTDRWKLVWAPRAGLGWGMGEGIGRSRDPEYLFDLKADPGETVNRAGHGDLEAAWLRSRLLAWRKSDPQEAEPPKGREPGVDDETAKRLRALGYAN